MKNLYCISGLGADERIFQRLNIGGVNLIPLPWVPFDKQDGISSYAGKMLAQINDPEPLILGLSFGGMIAVEIMKQTPVKQVFLVSSAKTIKELPEVSRGLKFLIRNGMLPYNLLKRPNRILFNLFGAIASDEKALLTAIMKDTDPRFMEWAFKAILNWQNEVIPPGIIHIHGTADRIIPPGHIIADHWIQEGTHMMIYNKAEIISNIISNRFSQLCH